MNYLISSFTILGSIFLIFFSEIIINNSKVKQNNEKNSKEFVRKIDEEINPLCKKNKSLENKIKFPKYIEKISISIPNSRAWSKNIMQAYISPNESIIRKYKKRFKGQVYWEQKNGYKCKFDANIRISGDFRDHIKMKSQNLVASLDVSLYEGNLNGFTKFKLLLPETRNGNSEIFTALLMKELGYISPRTFYINLDVNGVSYRAIAQENPFKEMIENNKRRESAILEINENIFWNKLFDNQWHSPKIINKNWLKQNNLNIDISIDALNLLSLATNEVNSLKNKPDYKDEILSGFRKDEKEKFSIYRAVLLANGAYHGLGANSRRFYYNPLIKSLEPVYYDGNSRIMISTWKNRSLDYDAIRNFKIRDLSLDDITLSKKKIESINKISFLRELNKSGLKINSKELNQKLEIIKSKLNQLERLVKNKNNKVIKANIDKFEIDGVGRIFHFKENFFTICNKNLEDCKKIEIDNLEDLYSILRGKYNRNNLIYLYSGLSPEFKNKKSFLEKEYKESFNIDDVSVLISGGPKLNIDKKRKELKIKLFDSKDKVIFYGGNLIDWDILIEAKGAANIVSKSRYDESLITGSINFLDIKVSSLRIKMVGGLNEDSINFVRSFGQIDKINIINSHQDAIDLDFSNLSIDRIIVNKAGNDCLDLSSGNYKIKNVFLSNCEDKAISLGEKGVLNLNQGKIYDSFSALVVKDSSKMIAKNIQTEGVQNCYLVYRKKQEFGESYLNLNNFICNKGNRYIQENSILTTK